MHSSRREFLRYSLAAPMAVGGISSILPALSQPAAAGTMPGLGGAIVGNDPSLYLRFAGWLGRKPPLTVLAFNQTNATELANSINWICQQGRQFIADGARVLWSVPCPGSRQLEAIAAGTHDTLYTNLFKAILAASPADGTGILVRLPWEFNLSWQENAAIDKNGQFNNTLFIQAFRRIATIAKGVSYRFQRIWCPNVTTMSLDPISCWPGAQYVEIISQDFYMQARYNKPGDFAWFLNEKRGLAWASNFAKSYSKPYGLSEWGMDSDIFVNDLNSAALWLTGLGTTLHHQCWWDRLEVIDCRLSDGTHPQLGAAYKNLCV